MITAGLGMMRRRASESAEHTIVAISALLFAVSATATIVWCTAMAAMGGMAMPGGWTMSMTWMRMPEQTWADAAASWLGMWIAMMTAMMLPSLVPMLLRYRESITSAVETPPGLLTTLVGVGYFCSWTLAGMVALALGFALAEAEMQYPALARAVPAALGAIVLIAGAGQFTAWKAHHLACCRESPVGVHGDPHERRQDAGVAWRYGMRLGFHCLCSSAGPTVVLLGMGVMDLRVMVVVTTAITAERLAPAGERVARAFGVVAVGAGMVLLAQAAGLR